MIIRIAFTVLRSIVAYLVLLILGRIIGRKLLSRITFFDFVVGIALGSLAVRISLGNESSLLLGIVASVTITGLVLLTDLLNIKSSLFRKLEEGEPVLVIWKGRLQKANLTKTRISISKLLMLLRQKNIFDVDTVDYAVIENDGQLSVLLKPERQPATAGEMNIPKSESVFPIDIIIDGKILEPNLSMSGHDRAWLAEQLHACSVGDAAQVFYAAVGTSGRLFVSTYRESI